MRQVRGTSSKKSGKCPYGGRSRSIRTTCHQPLQNPPPPPPPTNSAYGVVMQTREKGKNGKNSRQATSKKGKCRNIPSFIYSDTTRKEGAKFMSFQLIIVHHTAWRKTRKFMSAINNNPTTHHTIISSQQATLHQSRSHQLAIHSSSS